MAFSQAFAEAYEHGSTAEMLTITKNALQYYGATIPVTAEGPPSVPTGITVKTAENNIANTANAVLAMLTSAEQSKDSPSQRKIAVDQCLLDYAALKTHIGIKNEMDRLAHTPPSTGGGMEQGQVVNIVAMLRDISAKLDKLLAK